MRCSLISIALLVGWLGGCPGAAPAAPVGWAEVRKGLDDLDLQVQAVGSVELFEATRGMKEDVRMLKVRASPAELARLLAPFGVATKALAPCEAKALPAWSRNPAWKLPADGPYRCGAGRLKARASGADWLVLALVASDPDGAALVYLTLLQGS